MLPKAEGGLNMWDLHTKIIALRATMIMKMIRAPCPEIRQLFEAIDLLGKPTLSYLPYIIRRNSTAEHPLLLPLFEEISASMKLIQTRKQDIAAGQTVWDSDVDGCPLLGTYLESPRLKSLILMTPSTRWSNCFDTKRI